MEIHYTELKQVPLVHTEEDCQNECFREDDDDEPCEFEGITYHLEFIDKIRKIDYKAIENSELHNLSVNNFRGNIRSQEKAIDILNLMTGDDGVDGEIMDLVFEKKYPLAINTKKNKYLISTQRRFEYFSIFHKQWNC